MLLTVNVQARRSESTLRSVFSDRQQIESRRADAHGEEEQLSLGTQNCQGP
jgi:hypothetical protein